MESKNTNETLIEFLKENQKMVNSLVNIFSGGQLEIKGQLNQQTLGQSIMESPAEEKTMEILEKMSELIELNRVTLQTIDLLDKRIKRLHSFIAEKMEAPIAQENAPIEGGTGEYTQ